jgi:hypothetical protein
MSQDGMGPFPKEINDQVWMPKNVEYSKREKLLPT